MPLTIQTSKVVRGGHKDIGNNVLCEFSGQVLPSRVEDFLFHFNMN